MRDNIYEFLYRWVGKNYGTQEAEDPCYDLGTLANELANEFFNGKDRLKYLLEKEKVCGLDKEEKYELTQLKGE